MNINKFALTQCVAWILVLIVSPAYAGLTLYEKGDRKLSFGSSLQIQYRDIDADMNANSSNEIGFRIFRGSLRGSLDKRTRFHIQGEFGQGGSLQGNSARELRNFFIEHTFDNEINVRIGNSKFPFSREQLAPITAQQSPQRTLVGVGNSGTPARQVGIYLSGPRAKFSWDSGLALASVDRDNSQIDINTIITTNDGSIGGDPKGLLFGGRLQYFPNGYFSPAQGDFDRGPTKLGFAVAAYNWSNEGDTENGSAIVDDITGLELSAALRSRGFSVDAQYNRISASLESPSLEARIKGDGSVFDTNGDAELDIFALKGGYMLIPDTLELVLAYTQQDTENYAEALVENSVGVNYFIKQHALKFLLSYTERENINGIDNNDQDVIRSQFQFLF